MPGGAPRRQFGKGGAQARWRDRDGDLMGKAAGKLSRAGDVTACQSGFGLFEQRRLACVRQVRLGECQEINTHVGSCRT